MPSRRLFISWSQKHLQYHTVLLYGTCWTQQVSITTKICGLVASIINHNIVLAWTLQLINSIMDQIQPADRRPEWDRILSASQRNNADEIEYLITSQNVSPNHTNGVGQSALHVAALWGNFAAVETLLKYKANTKAQNMINGATPLHSAVQSMKKPVGNRTRCIQLILECGDCNPHITDSMGFTALSCLRELRKKGNISETDFVQGYEEMEQVLLSGISCTDDARNPIFGMIENCEVRNLKQYLVEHADSKGWINECDLKTGMSPLLMALGNVFDDPDMSAVKDLQSIKFMRDIISALLECGADVNMSPTSDDKKMSVLEGSDLKSKDYILDICKVLATMLTSTEDRDKEISSHLEDIIFQLLSNGASLSEKTIQLVHDAARRGHLETVKFWIEKLGVDVNTKGRQGLTPLHFAARSGKVDIVKYLLEIDTVNAESLDDRGKTALDFANVNNRDEIIILLEK